MPARLLRSISASRTSSKEGLYAPGGTTACMTPYASPHHPRRPALSVQQFSSFVMRNR